MLRTCEDRCKSAKVLLEKYHTELETASTQLKGEALANRITEINSTIDDMAENSRSFKHAVAIELDRFYRQVLGENYTKADLMIYLNQQKNHTQDEYGVMLTYPKIIVAAHDSIHDYYCQDME